MRRWRRRRGSLSNWWEGDSWRRRGEDDWKLHWEMGRNSQRSLLSCPASKRHNTFLSLLHFFSRLFIPLVSLISVLPNPLQPSAPFNQQVPSPVSNSVHHPCCPHNSVFPTSSFITPAPPLDLRVNCWVGKRRSFVCHDADPKIAYLLGAYHVIVWPVRGWIVKHWSSSRRSRTRVAAWRLRSAPRKMWKSMP